MFPGALTSTMRFSFLILFGWPDQEAMEPTKSRIIEPKNYVDRHKLIASIHELELRCTSVRKCA